MDKIYLLILECIENGASDFEVIKAHATVGGAVAEFNQRKTLIMQNGNLIAKANEERYFYCVDSETMPREEYRLRIEEHEIETI